MMQIYLTLQAQSQNVNTCSCPVDTDLCQFMLSRVYVIGRKMKVEQDRDADSPRKWKNICDHVKIAAVMALHRIFSQRLQQVLASKHSHKASFGTFWEAVRIKLRRLLDQGFHCGCGLHFHVLTGVMLKCVLQFLKSLLPLLNKLPFFCIFLKVTMADWAFELWPPSPTC